VVGRPKVSEESRFWSKVRKTDTCWLWTGSVDRRGYGRFGSWVGNVVKTVKAHRWAWEQEHGPIPEAMTIDHLCNTTGCVRPSHMRVATWKENHNRYYEEMTHCVNGHSRNGIGPCRLCLRDATRRWRARQGV
jgi:hypothetical protein